MATTLDKTQAAPPAPPQETAPPPVDSLLVQCESCSAPIAFDQTYCLECGTRNERPGGFLARFRTRRYVLGALAVLLAIGGIVGYAVAAASRHDAVKVASKTVPPAPVNQGTAAPPAAPTPPPAATTPAPPAAPAPVKPPAVKRPAATPPTAKPSIPAPSVQPSHPSSPGGTGHAQPQAPAPSTSKPPYAKLFGSGRSPVSAGPFDPNHEGGIDANSLTKVFDNDASTVWKSGAYANGVGSGVGFYVDDGAASTIRGLGVLTKTPGFDVQVYGYAGDTPPSSLSGWTMLGTQIAVGQRQKIALDLKGQQYQLYLLWFTKMPANGQRFEMPEVQILP